MLRSAILCSANDAEYGRHFTVVAPGPQPDKEAQCQDKVAKDKVPKEALYLYDDNRPIEKTESSAQPVYMMFLERAGPRPLPNAIYRALSVQGADRTAMMAGCFGEVVAKPYEAKSSQPVIEISVGGGAPAQVYVLHLSRTRKRRVYDGQEQQRKAISLLCSSPVAAWKMVANNAWQQHLDITKAAGKPVDSALGHDVINGFLDGMAGCLPFGEALALVTFCGSALKRVAVKRLPSTMLVEVEEKYGCYALIRECILIPPGLLSRKELEEYFPIGQQAVSNKPVAWPREKETALRRIMSEGMLLRPGVEYKQV